MRRLLIGIVLVVLWASFGFGVYHLLESRKSNLTTALHPTTPTDEVASVTLPGKIYVSQGGQLYVFANGRFTSVNLNTTGREWVEPAAGPNGDLLAVARYSEWSDIDLINPATGAVVKQLTTDSSPVVALNAWSMWPHLEADGTTVISGWDGPKYGTSYEVHFAVWSGSMSKVHTEQWTSPTLYTGGDVEAVPLPNGGVVYAHYFLNAQSQILSQITMVEGPGDNPVPLSDPTKDCTSPTVSADGSEIAMVCTSNTQTASLEVMSLTNGVAGKPRVLVASCLCASPAFSPDGHDLLFLAPVDATGRFELWWIKGAATATPSAPKSVTSTLDLEATSAPLWLAG